MSTLPPTMTPAEHYVDFAGALKILHSMGLTDITDRMVRRYADDGVLPFFSGLGKRRRISEHVLRMAVKRLQLDALKGRPRDDDDEPPRRR
jgi:hypothetical protein